MLITSSMENGNLINVGLLLQSHGFQDKFMIKIKEYGRESKILNV